MSVLEDDRFGNCIEEDNDGPNRTYRFRVVDGKHCIRTPWLADRNALTPARYAVQRAAAKAEVPGQDWNGEWTIIHKY